MKNDEFAFFNQQLAAMVRDGIPLEAALQRLSADMQRGPLRDEIQKLEADLARGVPLSDAIRVRELPELYQQMLTIGAQSNDLPAILTMLADHYQRRHVIWTRLKGLMVYPMIVLIGALALSCFLSIIMNKMFLFMAQGAVFEIPVLTVPLWFPPLLLTALIIFILFIINLRGLRRKFRWFLPAFREASLSQVASALALMLRNGVPLDKALGLVQQLERGTVAETELGRWRQRLATGRGKFSDMTAEGQLFPPLFLWTVSQSHEDLAGGFQQAAEIYQARANYRSEILLYAALPCAVLALGVLITSQIHPVISAFMQFFQCLGSDTF